MKEPISQEELITVVNNSGWAEVRTEEGCSSEEGATGSYICDMYGYVDGYEVRITPTTESSDYKLPAVYLHMK